MNSISGIAFATALMLALTGAVLYVHVRFSPHPEWTRKTAHVASGFVALSFPWIFDRSWPVLLLCTFAVTSALAARLWSPLEARLGRVINDVRRDTWGEIYFALIVGILFVASKREPVLYCIPLAVLTLADAAAAVVGLHSQGTAPVRRRGSKTRAGSAAFFIVAALVAYAGLSWLTALSDARMAALAVAIGLVTTPLEAAVSGGLDNLVVPTACFLVLKLALAA